MLKTKVKTVHEADLDDIETLIKETYGHEYEVHACEECSSDTVLNKIVDGKLDKFDQKSVLIFANTGKGGFILTQLLNDLAAQGLIPIGEYLIDAGW